MDATHVLPTLRIPSAWRTWSRRLVHERILEPLDGPAIRVQRKIPVSALSVRPTNDSNVSSHLCHNKRISNVAPFANLHGTNPEPSIIGGLPVSRTMP